MQTFLSAYPLIFLSYSLSCWKWKQTKKKEKKLFNYGNSYFYFLVILFHKHINGRYTTTLTICTKEHHNSRIFIMTLTQLSSNRPTQYYHCTPSFLLLGCCSLVSLSDGLDTHLCNQATDIRTSCGNMRLLKSHDKQATDT